MVFLVYWLYHATKLRRNIAMEMQQGQWELAGPLPALAPSGGPRGRVCLVGGATSGIGRATALRMAEGGAAAVVVTGGRRELGLQLEQEIRQRGDRKSTRLNSSHLVISYAVFCLKKKNKPYS